MKEFEKLLESGLLDEETKNALQEAIDKKVNEKIEESKDKLREDFAKRYEHDKAVMIEAADKMFSETMEKELKELTEEKQSYIESKVQYRKMIKNHAQAIQKFATSKLHEEVKELRQDRKELTEALLKFEKFAVKHLTTELKEFHEDKRDLVESKVRLVKEAQVKIDETKKDFVQKAALVTEAFIEEILRKEIGTFRKDIKEARKNNFGRRIFEAFAADFMASHLSDGTEKKKLVKTIHEREKKLSESIVLLKKQQKLLERTKAKVNLAESKLERHKKLNELLSPLPRDKKELMAELLDKVDTSRLDEAYKKHVKFVLREDSKASRKSLVENAQNVRSEVTGDREKLNERVSTKETDDDEIIKLKKLAGIN